MYATVIEFTVPEGTDWQALREIARQRAEDYYRDLPGLRFKAFVLDPERRVYCGLYVWETRQQLETFLDSDVFAGAREKFGQPSIRVYEVAALIEQGQVIAP